MLVYDLTQITMEGSVVDKEQYDMTQITMEGSVVDKEQLLFVISIHTVALISLHRRFYVCATATASHVLCL